MSDSSGWGTFETMACAADACSGVSGSVHTNNTMNSDTSSSLSRAAQLRALDDVVIPHALNVSPDKAQSTPRNKKMISNLLGSPGKLLSPFRAFSKSEGGSAPRGRMKTEEFDLTKDDNPTLLQAAQLSNCMVEKFGLKPDEAGVYSRIIMGGKTKQEVSRMLEDDAYVFEAIAEIDKFLRSTCLS